MTRWLHLPVWCMHAPFLLQCRRPLHVVKRLHHLFRGILFRLLSLGCHLTHYVMLNQPHQGESRALQLPLSIARSCCAARRYEVLLTLVDTISPRRPCLLLGILV